MIMLVIMLVPIKSKLAAGASTEQCAIFGSRSHDGWRTFAADVAVQTNDAV